MEEPNRIITRKSAVLPANELSSSLRQNLYLFLKSRMIYYNINSLLLLSWIQEYNIEKETDSNVTKE